MSPGYAGGAGCGLARGCASSPYLTPGRRPSVRSAAAPARATSRPVALILLVGVLAGCDGGGAGPGSGRAPLGPIPAEPQRAGDPARGYDALLNRAAVTCGLPARVFDRLKARDGRGPGPQFPGRTGRNRQLPYTLTAHRSPTGVELVTTNCLTCHAATLGGVLTMGLGNAFLDLTRDPLDPFPSATPLMRDGAERAEWRRWTERVTVLSRYTVTDTVGVNSEPNLTLALMAHRDPRTLAWSNTPRIAAPPERPLPVAVPPWWALRKKHALFLNGQGRGDQVRHLLLAAAICTDSVPEARALEPWFADVRAYLVTLTPPRYPYGVDAGLAAAGYRLFQAHCRGCHGTYGEGSDFPNRLVALGEVGTDPTLARAAYGDGERFRTWFQASDFGETARIAPALGYLAPPLDGVWATAPYLHNDSVPTLAALLDSPARPAYWRFRRDPADRPSYDPAAVGWAFDTLPAGKAAAMGWDERARIYDTSAPGYGNGGHGFSDGLDREERRALLEYLKTL